MFTKRLCDYRCFLFYCFFQFILFFFHASSLGVMYVDQNAPVGTNDGSSWANASLVIQDTITTANLSGGDEIWVADGTYAEAIALKSKVQIYGGFEGYGGAEETERSQRDWMVNEVIIDGSTAAGGGAAQHVVTMDNVTSSVIDGFTITGGYADGGHPENQGGGIFCQYSYETNTISHCLISNNSATSGGGIACYAGAKPLIDACIIRNNTGSTNWYGGGIHCLSNGNPLITNCLIINNWSGAGGGIAAYSASPTIVNCTISGNSADSPSSSGGGGIYARDDADPIIINTIFEHNTNRAVNERTSDSDFTLINCLFYNNPQGAFNDLDNKTYADSEVDKMNAEVPEATDNVTGDPQFVDKVNRDYHLLKNSVAIDKGTATGAPADDFDGISRPEFFGYDIGAFEFHPAVSGPADILLIPKALDFDVQAIQEGATASQTVYIINVGGEDLETTSVALTGADAAEFKIISDTSQTFLASGEMRLVDIAFDPGYAGLISANLTIQSGDPDEPIVHVALSGLGMKNPALAGLWPIGAALDFSSPDHRVIMGNFDDFPTTAITVSLWMKSPPTESSDGIFSFAALYGSDNEMLLFNQANLTLYVGGNWLETGQAFNDNEWHHIAVTWESIGGTLKLYRDGEEAFTGTLAPGNMIDPLGVLVLGEDQDDTGGGFDPSQAYSGMLDDVRLWNIVRSPIDIQADMHFELNGDETGLVGYWRLNEEAGTTSTVARDATVNGNDGILSSYTMWAIPSLAPIVDNDATTTTNELTNLVLTLDGYTKESLMQLVAVVVQQPVPGTGMLYQYDDGAPGMLGTLIDTTPTTVTDTQRRVVFSPDPVLTTDYDSILHWNVFNGTEYSDNVATYTITVVEAVATPTPTPTPTPTETPTPIPSPTPSDLVNYDFDTDNEGWGYAGTINPYEPPIPFWEAGHLGLNAGGSMNSFSYLYSPDIIIEDGKLYRSQWIVDSSCTGADEAVQFRLRVNQKGSWQAWNRTVNSNKGQAPSLGNPKDYKLFFDPNVTGSDDNLIVLNFDIMSFEWTDDAASWLYLDELVVDEATITTSTEKLLYSFPDTTEGWQFMGPIPPFDEPLATYTANYLPLSPNGSANCFSYWHSPDIAVEDGKVYRARFEMNSTVHNPDEAIQFRLRVNQKGSWQGWDRIVNSNNQQGPPATILTMYNIHFDPTVTDTDDDTAVFSFDIMSFDIGDDLSSWLYLEAVELQEIIIDY